MQDGPLPPAFAGAGPRRVGLKLRTPSRASVAFIRLTMRVRSPTRHSRSRFGRLASSSAIVGTRAMLQWPRSPRRHPKNPRLSNSVSSRSVLARRCSRDTATLEGWITCASTPRAFSQRANQKPSRPAFEGQCNPRDLFTGPDRFIAPAMQQAKKPFRTRFQLLLRLTLNAGKHPGNQPARLAQLDDGNDCAILVQGDEGPAQVVQLGHRGTPSVICQRRWCHLLRRLPHTISPLEEAVSSEPDSESRNSLLAGKIQGNSSILASDVQIPH